MNELEAIRSVAERIGPVSSVLELNARRGLHTTLIQTVNKPKYHTALSSQEEDANMVAVHPRVSAFQAEPKDWEHNAIPGQHEWIHADVRTSYLKWRWSKSDEGKLIDWIFNRAGRWVTITDGAIHSLVRFPKNREANRRVFRGPSTSLQEAFTWVDYVQEVASLIQLVYGFQCRDVAVWRKSAGIFLLERSTVGSTFVVREHIEKGDAGLLSGTPNAEQHHRGGAVRSR